MPALKRPRKRKQPPAPHSWSQDAQDLLTEAEVAKRLKCSIWFLRDDRRGARSVLPFIKIGARIVRYRAVDLEKALASMVQGAKN